MTQRGGPAVLLTEAAAVESICRIRRPGLRLQVFTGRRSASRQLLFRGNDFDLGRRPILSPRFTKSEEGAGGWWGSRVVGEGEKKKNR